MQFKTKSEQIAHGLIQSHIGPDEKRHRRPIILGPDEMRNVEKERARLLRLLKD